MHIHKIILYFYIFKSMRRAGHLYHVQFNYLDDYSFRLIQEDSWNIITYTGMHIKKYIYFQQMVTDISEG